MEKRRDFMKKVVIATGSFAIGNQSFGFTAKSYNRIIGANDRINVSIIGLNGRGGSMCTTFAKQDKCLVTSVCDVDSRTIPTTQKKIQNATGTTDVPKGEKDFRNVLRDKDVDAIYIATPDHWHAPMTILGCQAGKHVYVEKPLSHNPREGELAVEAALKYKRVVQMGAQRRSSPLAIQCMDELHNGVIGRIYFAKCWYTNARKAMQLKPAPIPDWLNYDLWQGPAPRQPYQDGLVHYNWHWLWAYGTGEALNNGTHEVDLARWGLGVDLPTRVTSVGGRYQFKDAWQTPDTQIVCMDYPGRISLMWENRSSNGRKIEGADRGVIFYGDNGSLDTDGEDYTVYDLNGKVVKQVKKQSAAENAALQGRNTASPSLGLDSLHVANFLQAIRENKKPNSDVVQGHKSVLAMQLGNIAWRVGRDLHINPSNGHIINDPEAQKLWSRAYEPGWEPKV
ncbi:Gfo/Idh/MocA family oxidoreductase [uncultured Mucilaginibacter sp.]|uniref:Gfo/Idh/MocA family protein n=1 Tax=uncultured Mucilaginibacter sp. TaxID=797541 RepID=UPI0025EA3EFF|nr:Gfo/Idh/MocA family oxidoreductase [uncultured Mucilaginibacter sp.]